MQSLSRLTLVLCCAWVLTILYGEMIAYWVPLWTCSWPQLEGDLSSSSSIDRTEVKVAIVADPQLMDRTSLSLAPKSLALETAKFYTDLYMRRSFRSSILPFKPNLVIFLGDHFDGGPYLADQEWKESYNRFKHIFGLEAHGRYSDILVYYLSGNHDIGYSNFHTQHPEQNRNSVDSDREENREGNKSAGNRSGSRNSELWLQEDEDQVLEMSPASGFEGWTAGLRGSGFCMGCQLQEDGVGLCLNVERARWGLVGRKRWERGSVLGGERGHGGSGPDAAIGFTGARFPLVCCSLLCGASCSTQFVAVSSRLAAEPKTDPVSGYPVQPAGFLVPGRFLARPVLGSRPDRPEDRSAVQPVGPAGPVRWGEELERRFRRDYHGREREEVRRTAVESGGYVAARVARVVIQRYEKEFGARNYRFSAGKLDFIVVDAQTLDGPKQGKETFLSWQFIKNISQADTVTPRVLLTHIPLYRPNDSLCGPHRSSSIINQRVSYAAPDQGIKYQNYLTKDTSDSLLHFIKPTLVLSGHDHDQCTVTHSTDFGSIVEHTLGTISWQQGNLYPSFMLLTARDSNATGSTNPVSTNLCFLPMQTHIYIWYLFQFAFTLLLFFVWPTNGFARFGRFAGFVSSVRSKWATMKEKIDEEDCEYDTIWDSEGSMHLIRKNKPRPVTSLDVGVTGRGNAVLRSSAKKQSTHEQDASILVLEANIDMNVDKSEKTRQSRSKITRLVLRLIRVLRMVIIIAAVNVPLYMMLLFKDWIDH
ncbi:hypothetical protein KSP40_PGU016595 [Platanthera guangdongensis]|uniref:Calcineurin-like phosphoesterase domain-containing protein n=1 Tax=Platanthera guangdongensis TaxID=2320717 RepID=A0ABR2LHM2_9ASPA